MGWDLIKRFVAIAMVSAFVAALTADARKRSAGKKGSACAHAVETRTGLRVDRCVLAAVASGEPVSEQLLDALYSARVRDVCYVANRPYPVDCVYEIEGVK